MTVMELADGDTVGFVVLTGDVRDARELGPPQHGRDDQDRRDAARPPGDGHHDPGAALAGLPRLDNPASSPPATTTRSRSTPTSARGRRRAAGRSGRSRSTRPRARSRRRSHRATQAQAAAGRLPARPEHDEARLEDAQRRSDLAAGRSRSSHTTRTRRTTTALYRPSEKLTPTAAQRRQAERVARIDMASSPRPTGAKDDKRARAASATRSSSATLTRTSRPRPEMRMTRRLKLSAEHGYSMAA